MRCGYKRSLNMTSVDAPVLSEEDLRTEAWNGFTDGNWKKDIDVRDFI